MNNFRSMSMAGASALALLVAGAAGAQVQPQPEPASPAAAPSASVTADGQSPAADRGDGTPATAGPAPADADGGGDIVVTGSRIPTNGFSRPTPVTVTSATQLNAAVPTNLGESLRQLPALIGSAGPRGAQQSSGQGGAYLNLRNLGTTRTLTLFDGRRFIPNDGSGQVDTNLFPQALVERVEVVTGGASAAYGSDAVAGVVNFVINKKFTGLTGNVQGGITTYGDNPEQKYELAYGTPFGDGRGHFIASAEFFRNEGVEDRLTRGYSRQSCQAISLPSGSATARDFACDVRVSNAAFGGLITGPTAFRGIVFDDNGQPQPFQYGSLVTGSTMVGGSGPRPQFAPLIVELEKHIAYARFSYDLTDAVTMFGEANYGKTHNDYQVGSYSNQIGSTALTIRRDNAYLPASLRDRMTTLGVQTLTMGRYDGDLPRTQVNVDQETVRFVGGLEGTVLNGLKWNTYVESAYNDRSLRLNYDLIQARYVAAADAVVNPANGAVVCRSTLTAPTNGCVPVNVFGFQPPSDAALNYVTGTNSVDQRFKEFVAAASIAGTPVTLWAGDLGFAAGLEYRRQGFDQIVDPLSEAYNPVTNAEGAYRVGNQKAQSGSYRITEGFVELNVPLLKDVTAVKELNFNGAARRTHYSTSGSVTTWKAGLSWQIVDDLRLRGTRSRDIRAPSLYELFQRGASNYIPLLFDRQTNTTATNVRQVILGNTELRPEVAKTTTFGVVFSPRFLPGFNASVDYYDIKIGGAIAQLLPTQQIDDCIAGGALACSLIQRNAAGQITQVNIITQNLNSFQTRGIDFELSYRSALPWLRQDARLSTRLLGNYLDRFVQQSRGAAPVDRTGQAGLAARWHATGQVELDMKPFAFFGQARYIGGGAWDPVTLPTDLPQKHIGDQTLFDTRISYQLPVAGKWETYLAVANVFNTLIDPYQSNGLAGVADFDSIGRTFRVGLRFTY
jgi:outer membrane receptor protein involved in Fe transport